MLFKNFVLKRILFLIIVDNNTVMLKEVYLNKINKKIKDQNKNKNKYSCVFFQLVGEQQNFFTEIF
jgi:hypothetical protein